MSMIEMIGRLMMQLVFIFIVTRIMGYCFKRMKQPAVIGEIIAGIIMGTSVLGHYFPTIFQFVFPKSSYPLLESLSNIGLALFMFVMGSELEFGVLRAIARKVLLISYSSVAIPFVLGFLLAFSMYPGYTTSGISVWLFALFMGVALSITAFPVLARIIKARDMHQSSLGILVVSIAAVADVIAWCLLALVMAIAKAQSAASSMASFAGIILYTILMFTLVRKGMTFLFQRFNSNALLKIVSMLLLLIFSSFITSKLGVHLLFGAFVAGVILPQNASFRQVWLQPIETFSISWLLPVFFVLTGLRLQLFSLDLAQHASIACCLLLAAVFGKITGSALPARWLGSAWKEAWSVGVLMNTRGLVELVVLNIGFELGIISASLFAILVLMAIVITNVINSLDQLTFVDLFNAII